MEFTATNVKKEKVDQRIFELPKDYKIVSKEEMQDFFKSVQ